MKRVIQLTVLISQLMIATAAMGQQSQDFGQYVVYFNALNTTFIPPEVAAGYNIQRSSTRGLLNIVVLRKVMGNPGTPLRAQVKSSAINLNGQLRDITMREISEPGMDGNSSDVYYIGEFRINNKETFDFTVEVTPEGEDKPLVVRFRRQFFTE